MGWDKEYILELKSDRSLAPMIEENISEKYRIKILHRGEQLFYHDKNQNRAIIIEIQVRNGSIFESSIKTWEDNTEITKQEKELILLRLKKYFKNFQQIEAAVR
ncbi:hypothetical protein [Zobellia uliginosa]|uniref:hypothetical protein n=1 Tax=Zobellia uliginosa TaxID=143224 RepID=UPI0026E1B9DF|nr:hypothetical protein [Zobellia uliginosa]MDO6519019.1 hypothetical protein [Zobellia uliginosa]